MARIIKHTGGVFEQLHKAQYGADIDFDELRPADHDPQLVEEARAVWLGRVQSEFRSIQIMTGFMSDILDAGDPLEVYAGAADMINDEIAHTSLCVGVCEALGQEPGFPETIEYEEGDDFLNLPAPQRALARAISMLGINETLSTGFISDLRDRCHNKVIRAVLDATLEDESGHHEYGWSYIRASLERFGGSGSAYWREVARKTLEPHRRRADEILQNIPSDQQNLGAWKDEGRVELGLFSPQRQALVFRETYQTQVAPQLLDLGLI